MYLCSKLKNPFTKKTRKHNKTYFSLQTNMSHHHKNVILWFSDFSFSIFPLFFRLFPYELCDYFHTSYAKFVFFKCTKKEIFSPVKFKYLKCFFMRNVTPLYPPTPTPLLNERTAEKIPLKYFLKQNMIWGFFPQII